MFFKNLIVSNLGNKGMPKNHNEVFEPSSHKKINDNILHQKLCQSSLQKRLDVLK